MIIAPSNDTESVVMVNTSSQTTVIETSDAAVQVYFPPVKPSMMSKGTQVLPSTGEIATSPVKWTVADHSTPPASLLNSLSSVPLADISFDLSSGEEEESDDDDDDYLCNRSDVSSGSSTQSVSEPSPTDWQQLSLKRTRHLLDTSSKLYLGLSRDNLSVIDLLAYKIDYCPGKVTARDIVCLVFRKIRLNESFEILGHEFGISESRASFLFGRYVSFIADHLKELIVWPSSDSIKKNLPVSFRKNYNKVESIIDALETQIEKPSDPVNQSLTWSDYKKCNTMKHFLSITPDGLINFVSKGYGGRISDEMLTSVCGFVPTVPRMNVHILADRGFKKIEPLLSEKKCILVRPASVISGQKLEKKRSRVSNYRRSSNSRRTLHQPR